MPLRFPGLHGGETLNTKGTKYTKGESPQMFRVLGQESETS